MAAEFKISYFRYTWVGQWQPSTQYAADSMVQYQGKMYVCTIANTSSSNFNTDLFASPYPYWSLVIDGKTWIGTWTPSTSYSLGNLVEAGGFIYACTVPHTSSSTFSANSSNWVEYTQTCDWRSTWTISTVYEKNDIVKYGGIVYKCIAEHTSATNLTLGLEANQSSWAVFYQGIEYKNTWTSNSRYKLNDLVKLDADIYIATTGHTSSSTFDSANWAVWIPGQIFNYNWTAVTSYQLGDIVVYGGDAYISKISNNLNNIPSSATTDWALFNQGYSIQNDWASNIQYAVGDVVRRNGITYEAILDSIGQDPAAFNISTTYTASGSSGTALTVNSTTGIVPGMIVHGVGFSLAQSVSTVTNNISLVLNAGPDGATTDGESLTFTGVNYVYWKLLTPGINWLNQWTSPISYSVGDLVTRINGTYICTTNHTSSPTNSPDVDITNTYWSLYIAHDRNNSMSQYGDMETFNGGVYQPVHIGTQEYLLRSTNGLPQWTKINVIPAVYYVDSAIGSDRSDYGTTWDQPWQSIRYACNFIGQGAYFATTASRITSNKGWIITEMYQWMLYQMANSIAPFSPSSLWDPTYAQRDAGYIIDAIVYDMERGGNSQTVAATLKFFYYGTTNVLVNSLVESSIQYFVPALQQLLSLIINAASNTAPAQSYQVLNGIESDLVVNQYILGGPAAESGAISEITSLMGIVTTALANQNTTLVPSSNSGLTAILYVRTGTYNEVLPITVPENLSIVGDELRSVAIQPATSIEMFCTSTISATNTIVVTSTAGLADQMPLQFISPPVNGITSTFGGVISGKTYYVIGSSIVGNSFQVQDNPTVSFVGTVTSGSEIISNVSKISNLKVGMTISGTGIPPGATIVSINQAISSISTITISSNATGNALFTTLSATGSIVTLTDGAGSMLVYAGDCLKDMFYMRNGTTMRNFTMFGLQGTLSSEDSYQLARPTGGCYTSLDPGNGPDDTSVWIIRRSPYMQNITNFGTGCTGTKIDGTLHNGGSKSMLHNDYTQVLSDGIGVYCTGTGSITECVSVFSYYCYIGHFAENGGRIRSTNGNSSYGTYGAVSEGFDITETPITGTIFNRSVQVQASVQSSFSTAAQLLKLGYSNAGSAYYNPTTNFLKYSNNFLSSAWASDGNLTYIKNEIAPTGITEGWLLTGSKSTSGTGYVYQNIPINSAGGVYLNVPAQSLTGSGSSATFNVTVTSTNYIVTVSNSGTLYAATNELLITGDQLGGVPGTNDLVLTVTGLTGSGVASVSYVGTVPTGSSQGYTLSLYVYPGTSASVDLQGIFSGSSTLIYGINYNVTTNIVTPYSSGSQTFVTTQGNVVVSASVPVHYGAQKTLSNGWYRIWMSITDDTGINSSLQYRYYPQGYTNPVANQYSICYAAQVELSSGLYSPNFYFETTSAMYTSYANFEVSGAGTGAILVGDEIRSNGVFQARIVANSTGISGGAGYINASNNAQAGDTQTIQIAQSEQGINNYVGMRVFIDSGTGAGQYGYVATYNNSTKTIQVLQESVDPITISGSSSSGNLLVAATGSDFSKFYVNQAVQFTPTYYNTIVSETSIASVQVTAAIGGTTNTLTVASTSALAENMPITFSGSTFSTITTGYVYYIIAIIDAFTIQISTQQYGTAWQLTTATGTMVMNYPDYYGYLTATSTANMVINIPIQFTGTSLGGITLGNTYYICEVIDAYNFTVSNLLVTLTATATNSVGNLITVPSTSSLVPLNPIVFSGSIIDANITAGQQYYISSIPNSSTFTVSASVIVVTATATAQSSDLITVSSTAGFVVNQPIKFVGLTFGGIIAETTYYIQTINDAYTFTISQLPSGSALALLDASGSMLVKTCPLPLTLAGGSGSMNLTSTGIKTVVTGGYGTMNATFSTAVFGGVSTSTVYYILSISGLNITVGTAKGGSAITLTNATGNMEMCSVGWDHINPGTPIASNLDSTSRYIIEPRPIFTAPGFSQSSAASVVTLSGGAQWKKIASGNNTFIAIPSNGTKGAISTDGSTWSTMTLPASALWTDITQGNNFWIAISSGGTTAVVSNSNGLGWKPSTLPISNTWNYIAYGNGIFATISDSNVNAAYSTNFGTSWSSSILTSDKTIIGSNGAQISTSQHKFGTSSLSFNGTSSYATISSAPDFNFGTGDFTIECWVYPNSFTTAPGFIDTRTTNTEYALCIDISTSGNLRLFMNGSYVITANTALSANTWTHVAISRVSGVTNMFVGGVLQTTSYTDTNNYPQRSITIGSYYTHASFFNGYIDDLRISKIGRYTVTFTPVATAFTPDTNTTFLSHFDGNNGSIALSSITITGTWVGLAYGSGIFLGITSNGQGTWSYDGINWQATSLPTGSTYASLTFGNGRFVAVQSGVGAYATYSFDGINWNLSNTPLSASVVTYGQGCFVALASSTGAAYTSDSGLYWTTHNIASSTYSTLKFGYTATNVGVFVGLGGTNTGNTILAGVKPQAKIAISSGVITSILIWEPGSNYSSAPTVSFVDYNEAVPCLATPRISSGVLANPTFVNRGLGYDTSSTAVTITGNGYADTYQTGYTLIINNLNSVPLVGSNLTITGNNQVYKVTSAYAVFGTTAPFIEANVQISPTMSNALSPSNGTVVSIRQLYSQCRLTNHDFLSIGTGNQQDTNYPYVDSLNEKPQNEVVEANQGRVFYTSTDQDGNFEVGGLFGVQQATGTITLSATQFGLQGLNTLNLGGIAVGGSSTTITQFSTDSSFTANSDSVIPTQKAIKAYLTGRLSQGGANTFTGQLTAGTVLVGGANFIKSTIPAGQVGSSVIMYNSIPGNASQTSVYFKGASGYSTVDGNMAALQFFLKNGAHRS
jgi:Concanavalin A-like lectin/glucanases superfamily